MCHVYVTKAILYAIGDDIALVAGPLYTCAGQFTGFGMHGGGCNEGHLW